MPQVEESALIKDVYTVNFQTFGDERGQFMETFRKEWFPQCSWDIVQTNRSESVGGVIRGLHYHFHQVDYWMVAAGTIRADLYDMRPDSPTQGVSQTVKMGGDNKVGLFIPIGVAHGFVTLSDAVLIYIVDNYYNGNDEHGIAWDDSEIAMPWSVESPVISPRDANNPLLKDIPLDKRPNRMG